MKLLRCQFCFCRLCHGSVIPAPATQRSSAASQAEKAGPSSGGKAGIQNLDSRLEPCGNDNLKTGRKRKYLWEGAFVLLIGALCLAATPSEAKMNSLLSKAKNIQHLDYTVEEGDTLYDLAQKHGTTIELIKATNDLKGDLLYPGMKLKILQGVFSIQVDKSDNQLFLLLNDQPLRHYPVATGAENKTPVGDFKIVNKVEHPTWYKAGVVVPPGSPDNLLGTRWLGFDFSGYGIHGTVEPESIGKHVSLGCIRMLNQDVEELYSLLPLGTKVTVKD